MALIKCQNCGKPMRIGTEQVGFDERSLPVIHRFSYCDTCHIKNDLDLITYTDQRKSWYLYHRGLLSLIISLASMLTIGIFIGIIGFPFALYMGIQSLRTGTIYRKSAIAGIIISSFCIILYILAIFQILIK